MTLLDLKSKGKLTREWQPFKFFLLITQPPVAFSTIVGKDPVASSMSLQRRPTGLPWLQKLIPLDRHRNTYGYVSSFGFCGVELSKFKFFLLKIQ